MGATADPGYGGGNDEDSTPNILQIDERCGLSMPLTVGRASSYIADNFQNAIERQSRKIRAAIKYAALSPIVVLKLNAMREAQIKARQRGV
jgi:hypothetical protein